MKKLILVMVTCLVLVGCSSDASVVSHNISKDAEQFKVHRRIVFLNLRSGEYEFQIEGNCSTEVQTGKNQLAVTCKLGENEYQKHFLGLTEGISYTVEQLEWVEADKYRYEIVFKPESIIPVKIDKE